MFFFLLAALYQVLFILAWRVYQGIISDLFPGVVLPKPDYDLLIKALNDNIARFNLQPVPWFLGKIIQVSRQEGNTWETPWVGVVTMVMPLTVTCDSVRCTR